MFGKFFKLEKGRKEGLLRSCSKYNGLHEGKGASRSCRINSHQASRKARQINAWPLKICTILVSFLRYRGGGRRGDSLERVTSLLVTGYTVNLLDLVRWRQCVATVFIGLWLYTVKSFHPSFYLRRYICAGSGQIELEANVNEEGRVLLCAFLLIMKYWTICVKL